MLKIFNALSSGAYYLLVIGLCSIFGIKAFASEFHLKRGTSNFITISESESQEFFKAMDSIARIDSEQAYWDEIKEYYKKLPQIAQELDGQSLDYENFIFPMSHSLLTKLIVKNLSLLKNDLVLDRSIRAQTVDQMILRDSVEAVYDYYYAMTGKEASIGTILKTLGESNYKKMDANSILGSSVHAFDINEKHLGSSFFNNHYALAEWVELVGEISTKDALDLAFEDDFAGANRHPVLGGKKDDIYNLFKNSSKLFANIIKIDGQIADKSMLNFRVSGIISTGEVLSLLVCSHQLKLEQFISDEFKLFCDFVFYRSFHAQKHNAHPTRAQFDALNSRYHFHF